MRPPRSKRTIVFRVNDEGTSQRFEVLVNRDEWKETIRREAEILGMALVPGGVA
jgi:hypothetical protein